MQWSTWGCMKLNFRKASNSDLNTLLAISKQTIDKSYRYWLDNEDVNQYLSSNSLDKYLKNNIDFTWVAIIDDEIVGFAICIENVIDFMLVGYKFQRNGYGSQILNFCEIMLMQTYDTIALESFEKNTKATAFYSLNKWEIVNKYMDAKSNSTKLIFSKNKFNIPLN